MNKTALAGVILVVGILIGIGIGYFLYYPQGGPITKTVTKTVTTPVTKTTTATQVQTQTVRVEEKYTILLSYDPKVGLYLTDSKGMTLYFFAKDVNGTSACYGGCAKKWPVFAPKPTTNFVIPSVLNITDFNFIVRDDGNVQVTYKGHPLYYWINDTARGDTKGHGIKGVWFVASTSGELP
ncbi:MAG: hypothetical protein QI197_08185 [Candidatus Korarchaeota archaeon]|nr:hypothetical protein [Candidatus Korarchaeota archaeon]